MASLRIVPKLPSFAEHFPGVELQLSSSSALSDPERDGFDSCIRYGPGGWGEVDARVLAREHVAPVCAPTLPPDNRAASQEGDWSRLMLIHDFTPVGWSEWFGSAGPADAPARGWRFGDSAQAVQAAVAGLGVALGRLQLIQPSLKRGSLVRLGQRTMPSPIQYWLVRPRNRPSTLVDQFQSWLLQEVLTTDPVSANQQRP